MVSNEDTGGSRINKLRGAERLSGVCVLFFAKIDYRLRKMVSVISLVPRTGRPACARSAVRAPSFNAFSTALSTASASAERSNAYLSIIDAERMVAMGLAMFLPAMVGAEPWMGS